MNYSPLVLLIISNLVVAIYAQHCILYEFHEKAVHRPRKSEILGASCESKGGRILKYTSVIMNTVGPPVFNVTFHCCQNKACFSDLDCSFNFQCKSGKCTVANCDLSDTLDTVTREDDECIINDDCYFTIPNDVKNWGCIRDAGCGVYKNCTKGARFCKRCPTGYYKDVPKSYVSTTTTVKPISVTTAVTTPSTLRTVSTERVTKPSTVASTTTLRTRTRPTTTTASTTFATTVINENTVTETEAVTETAVRNETTSVDDLLFNVTTVDENLINATASNVDVTSVTLNDTTVLPILLNSDAISGNNSLLEEDEDYNNNNAVSNSNNAVNGNNTIVFESRNETRNEIN